MGRALHAGQDKYAGGHNFKKWKGFHFNWETAKHLFQDAFPSPTSLKNSTFESIGIIARYQAVQKQKSKIKNKKKKMIKNIIISILFIIVLSNTIYGEEMETKRFERYGFVLDPPGILVPINKILLLRKENSHGKGKIYGAIKFIEINKEKKYAVYEYYYQNDGSGNFLKENVKKGKKKLKDRYWSLIGRVAFQLGTIYIKCGKFKLDWTSPSWVYFDNDSGEYIGIEMAPTPWSNIKDVNVYDKSIKWYSYDDKNEKIIEVKE